MTTSILDNIPGVGETRRKKLLRTFGSVKRLREASLDELKAVPRLPAAVAESVFEALHPHDPAGSAGSQEAGAAGPQDKSRSEAEAL